MDIIVALYIQLYTTRECGYIVALYIPSHTTIQGSRGGGVYCGIIYSLPNKYRPTQGWIYRDIMIIYSLTIAGRGGYIVA